MEHNIHMGHKAAENVTKSNSAGQALNDKEEGRDRAEIKKVWDLSTVDVIVAPRAAGKSTLASAFPDDLVDIESMQGPKGKKIVDWDRFKSLTNEPARESFWRGTLLVAVATERQRALSLSTHARCVLANIPLASVQGTTAIVWLPNRQLYTERLLARNRQVESGEDRDHSAKDPADMLKLYDAMKKEAASLGLTVIDEIVHPTSLVGIEPNPGPSATIIRGTFAGEGDRFARNWGITGEYAMYVACMYNEVCANRTRVIPICPQSYLMFKDCFPEHEFGENDNRFDTLDFDAWSDFMMNAYGQSVLVVAGRESDVAKNDFKLIVSNRGPGPRFVPAPRLVGIEPNPGPPSASEAEIRLFSSFMPAPEPRISPAPAVDTAATNRETEAAQAAVRAHRDNLERVRSGLEPVLSGFTIENLRAAAARAGVAERDAVENLGKWERARARRTAPNSPQSDDKKEDMVPPPIELRNGFAILAGLMDSTSNVELDIMDCVVGVCNLYGSNDRTAEEDLALYEISLASEGKQMGMSWKKESIVGQYITRAHAALAEKREKEKKQQPAKKPREGEDKGGKVMKEQKREEEVAISSKAEFVKWRLARRVAYNTMRARNRAARQHEYLESVWLSQALATNALTTEDATELFGETTVELAQQRAKVLLWLGEAAVAGENARLDQHQFPAVGAFVRTSAAVKAVRRVMSVSLSLRDALQARLLREGIEANPGPNPSMYRVDPAGGVPSSANPLNNPGLSHSPVSRWISQPSNGPSAPVLRVVDMGMPAEAAAAAAGGMPVGPDVSQYLRNAQEAVARANAEADAINGVGARAAAPVAAPHGGMGALGALSAVNDILPLASHYYDQYHHAAGRQPAQSARGGLNTAAAFATALSQLGLAAGAENPIAMLQAVAGLVEAIHGVKSIMGGKGDTSDAEKNEPPAGAVPLVRGSPAVHNQQDVRIPMVNGRYYEGAGVTPPAQRLVGIETNPGPAFVPAARLVGIEPNPGPPMETGGAASSSGGTSSTSMLRRSTMAIDPLNAGTVDDQMAASVAVSSTGVVSSVQTFELTKSADAIAENIQPTDRVFQALNTNAWFGKCQTMSFANDRLGAPATVTTKSGALLVGDYNKSLAGNISHRGSYAPNIGYAQSRVSFRAVASFVANSETVRNNKFVVDNSVALQGRANCSSGLSALGEVLQLGIGKMIQGSPDQVINANVQNILKLSVGGLPVGTPVGLNATVFYYFMAELDRARPDDKSLDLYVIGRYILMAINRRGMSGVGASAQVDFFPNPLANNLPVVTPGNIYKTNTQPCPKAFAKIDIAGNPLEYNFYVGTLTDYLNAWRSYSAGRVVAGNYQDIFNGINSGETRLITCMAANMSNALESGCMLVSAWAATNVLPLDNNGNLSYLGQFVTSNPPKTFVLLFNTSVPDTVQIGNFLLQVGPKFGASNRLGETAAVYPAGPPANTVVIPTPTPAPCLDLSGFGKITGVGQWASTESVGGDVALRAFNNLAAFASRAMIDRTFSWLGRGVGRPFAANMFAGDAPGALSTYQDLHTPNGVFTTGPPANLMLGAVPEMKFVAAQRTSYANVVVNAGPTLTVLVPQPGGVPAPTNVGIDNDHLFDQGCDYCPMNTGEISGMTWLNAVGNEVGEYQFIETPGTQPTGTCYTPTGMANDIIDVATKMGICSQDAEDNPFTGCVSLAAFENTVYTLSVWKCTVAEIAMKAQQIDKSLLAGMMTLMPYNVNSSPEPETQAALNMKGRIWQTIYRQTGGLVYRPGYYTSVATFFGLATPSCSFSTRPLVYAHCSTKAPIAVRIGFSGHPCDHTVTRQPGVNLTFTPTPSSALKDTEQSIHTSDPTAGTLGTSGFYQKYFSRAYDTLFDDRSYCVDTGGVVAPKAFLGKLGFGVINAGFNVYPWNVACWSTTAAAYMLQANQIEDITNEALWSPLAANPRVRFAPRVIMDMYRLYDATTTEACWYLEVDRGYNPAGIVGNVEDDINEYEPASYVPTTASRPNFMDSSTYTLQGAANGVDGAGTTSVGAFLTKRAGGASSSSHE